MIKPDCSTPLTASALLIMLWAVALMSATTLGLATYLQYGLEEDAIRSKEFRARQLAESGLAVAIHQSVKKNDPILRQELGPVEKFSVSKISEEARININVALADEDDTILQDLFIEWGMELQDADMVIDSLRDWVDGDDLARLSGIEREGYTDLGYPQFPRNKPFSSLDEVTLCRGIEILDQYQPGWQEFFTVWSNGKINVNDASADVLEFAVGLSELQVESLIDARNGLDEMKDTEDDLIFEDLNQVRIFLGMGEIEFSRISDRLTTNSSLERIVSTGTVADYSIMLSALVQPRSGEILFILEE